MKLKENLLKLSLASLVILGACNRGGVTQNQTGKTRASQQLIFDTPEALLFVSVKPNLQELVVA